MYEDVLDSTAQDARRQPSTTPVEDALNNGEYVCPMLGRACLEDACKLYVYGEDGIRKNAGTGCAWAVMAMALHGLDATGIECF